jgi:hypothetical protein
MHALVLPGYEGTLMLFILLLLFVKQFCSVLPALFRFHQEPQRVDSSGKGLGLGGIFHQV